MTAANILPILIPVVALGMILVGSRLSKVVQPLRLKMAEKGEALLAKPNLPDPFKTQIEFMLSNAFGGKLHFFLVIILTPIALAAYLLVPPLRRRIDRAGARLDTELEAEYEEVLRLFDKITMGNHPFLWLALQLVDAVIIPIFLLVAVLRSKKISLDNSDTNRWIGFMKSVQVIPFNRFVAGHL